MLDRGQSAKFLSPFLTGLLYSRSVQSDEHQIQQLSHNISLSRRLHLLLWPKPVTWSRYLTSAPLLRHHWDVGKPGLPPSCFHRVSHIEIITEGSTSAPAGWSQTSCYPVLSASCRPSAPSHCPLLRRLPFVGLCKSHRTSWTGCMLCHRWGWGAV